jgi:MurNAc alpha-1-phosphate uridylyltransferase
MLVVNKNKSFDKNLKGDFNLENNQIDRENKENLKYIYTGLQIINPEVFLNIKEKVFSINKIWDKLIKNNELFGMESNIDFLHVSTLDIYKNLNVK